MCVLEHPRRVAKEDLAAKHRCSMTFALVAITKRSRERQDNHYEENFCGSGALHRPLSDLDEGSGPNAGSLYKVPGLGPKFYVSVASAAENLSSLW